MPPGDISSELILQTMQDFHKKVDAGFEKVYAKIDESSRENREQVDELRVCMDKCRHDCDQKYSGLKAEQTALSTSMQIKNATNGVKEKEADKISELKFFIVKSLGAAAIVAFTTWIIKMIVAHPEIIK